MPFTRERAPTSFSRYVAEVEEKEEDRVGWWKIQRSVIVRIIGVLIV